MSNVLDQDILTIAQGAIVHQVNCQGVMGSGLALDIRRKYPVVYAEYRYAGRMGWVWPGQILPVWVSETLAVINLFGQDSYGTRETHTILDAHLIAWPKIFRWVEQRRFPVYVPWKIGCGLGGGDWELIKPLAEQLCPTLIWCRKRNRT